MNTKINIYESFYNFQNLNNNYFISFVLVKSIKKIIMSQNNAENVNFHNEPSFPPLPQQTAPNDAIFQEQQDYESPSGNSNEDEVQEFEDEHSAEAAMTGNELVNEFNGD